MKLLLNLDVPDLVAAEAFYTAAFGLVTGRRLGGGGVLELLGAPAPIYLLDKRAGSVGAAGAVRDYARHWTPLHGDVVVDRLEPALERALAAGARVESGIGEAAWGRIAQIADPFGHGWCLIEFSARGYDAIADTPKPRDL